MPCDFQPVGAGVRGAEEGIDGVMAAKIRNMIVLCRPLCRHGRSPAWGTSATRLAAGREDNHRDMTA